MSGDVKKLNIGTIIIAIVICRILCRRLGNLIKYNLDKANEWFAFLFLALKTIEN